MKVTIRVATIDDLEKVQELNLKLFEKEYRDYDPLLNLNWTFGKEGTKYFRERILRNDGCVLVAVVEDEIVGYLCGGIKKVESYRNLPSVAELENMFILKPFRSRGIGKQLLNEFVRWCESKKISKVKVEASASNKKAIKFYRANGFKNYTLILERDLETAE